MLKTQAVRVAREAEGLRLAVLSTTRTQRRRSHDHRQPSEQHPPSGTWRFVTDQQSDSRTALTIATCLAQLNFQNGAGTISLGVTHTTEIRWVVWAHRGARRRSRAKLVSGRADADLT